MLIINSRIQIPLSEFNFAFARSGGPGGQNVNKVNSKAILRWAVVITQSLPYDVKARFLEKFANRLTAENEIIITTPFTEFGSMQKALEERGLNVINSELQRIPTTYKELSGAEAEEINTLIEKIEEDEDVQNVFHNMKEV